MANVKLLLATYSEIKEHPESHLQEVWRCKSGMCFAGHAAVLGGAEFYSDARHGLASFVANPERYGLKPDTWASVDPRDYRWRYWLDEGEKEEFPVGLRHVADVAEVLLDISEEERDELFHHDNTLDDIRRVIQEITGIDPEDPGDIEGLVNG